MEQVLDSVRLGYRHQCLIYQGSPSAQLTALASAARRKLQQNYRCMYLNSPAMVAAMCSFLAAAGIDVADQLSKGNLVLTSERQLSQGQFDADGMIDQLRKTLVQTKRDGYAGLWATGDMTWELGPGEMNFSQLLDYEWRPEQLFQEEPSFCGICQYHRDTLPREAMRFGLISHPALFLDDVPAAVNRHYVHPEKYDRTATYAEMEAAIETICRQHNV
jgi:hypothetical protein